MPGRKKPAAVPRRTATKADTATPTKPERVYRSDSRRSRRTTASTAATPTAATTAARRLASAATGTKTKVGRLESIRPRTPPIASASGVSPSGGVGAPTAGPSSGRTPPPTQASVRRKPGGGRLAPASGGSSSEGSAPGGDCGTGSGQNRHRRAGHDGVRHRRGTSPKRPHGRRRGGGRERGGPRQPAHRAVAGPRRGARSVRRVGEVPYPRADLGVRRSRLGRRLRAGHRGHSRAVGPEEEALRPARPDLRRGDHPG